MKRSAWIDSMKETTNIKAMSNAYDKYLQQEAAEWAESVDEETTDGYLEELEEAAKPEA